MASAANPRRLAQFLPLLLLISLNVVPKCSICGQFSAELLSEKDPRRCRDSFDGALRKQCMRGDWEQKYYFEAESHECRLFWYDGCPGLTGSRNFFDSLLECQWLCEPNDPLQDPLCLEPFDEHLRDECDGAGKWRRHFYFDRSQRRCLPFWFDGCASPHGNHFEDEISCDKKCGVVPAQIAEIHHQTLGTKQTNFVPAWRLISTTLGTLIEGTKIGTGDTKTQQKGEAHWPTQKAMRTPKMPSAEAPPKDSISRGTPSGSSAPRKYAVPTAADSSSTRLFPAQSHFSTAKNICAGANPCQNGGICVYDELTKQTICKCAPQFTNDFCTERIDFDPCSPNPCKNGATCSAIAGPQRTEFDCFCARGFAGRHCEFRPCEDNPCKNGGTCRTTRAQSLFFCACPPGWAGKTCMVGGILSNGGISGSKSANLTRQLSSGKAEWIDELKRVTPAMPNSAESIGEGRPNSVVLPRDQIIGHELPTRTLKGTTAEAAANGAKTAKKRTDDRGWANSAPWELLAICCSLIISFCF